ncbi:helix-turn-helix domain-containing protein [Paenibacillus sp. Lou8.1]|uniref:helix-turn-helix domain-containing protein n=1 Tax=Paenibacillus sp. Lou8.1 TaxID=2962041 RepID=UPI0020B83B07|nr:helix-turn-helix domain-containing protein [Paenibacillus sp. Lou8.1]MCP3810075.1 helix-turn-helix domain-containing protein [Paenibacillus sp. Lou8.1]
MEIFSARLKWLREKQGITQKDMAEFLSVSQPYYGRFEKGTGQPNLESLVKLPIILDESLDFICGVTSIDREARDISKVYIHARHALSLSQERLDTIMELPSSENKLNFEHKIELIERERVRIRNYQLDKDHYFSLLIDHLNTIPFVDTKLFDEESWDFEYDKFAKFNYSNFKRKP